MKRILTSFKPATGKALGPLEQRLLQELWSRGTATVRELVRRRRSQAGVHDCDDDA